MDLTFALMRLHALEERLAQEHPEAARDERLVGLLQSLRDDLTDQQIIAELDA